MGEWEEGDSQCKLKRRPARALHHHPPPASYTLPACCRRRQPGYNLFQGLPMSCADARSPVPAKPFCTPLSSGRTHAVGRPSRAATEVNLISWVCPASCSSPSSSNTQPKPGPPPPLLAAGPHCTSLGLMMSSIFKIILHTCDAGVRRGTGCGRAGGGEVKRKGMGGGGRARGAQGARAGRGLVINASSSANVHHIPHNIA